jgi:hypothetical protein
VNRSDERRETLPGIEHVERTIPHDFPLSAAKSQASSSTISTTENTTPEAETRRPESELRADSDAALRAAIKAAVDAGDLVRASTLLDILKAAATVTTKAGVIELASRRQR